MAQIKEINSEEDLNVKPTCGQCNTEIEWIAGRLIAGDEYYYCPTCNQIITINDQ